MVEVPQLVQNQLRLVRTPLVGFSGESSWTEGLIDKLGSRAGNITKKPYNGLSVWLIALISVIIKS